MGYRDFSGCGPVHLLGGTCSLFGAAFLGPRLGRFSSKFEDSQELAGHSVPVSVNKIYTCVFSGEVHGTKISRVRESFGRDRENLVYIILN
jgi:hypothetical protein